MTCPTSLSIALERVDMKDRQALFEIANAIKPLESIGLTAKAYQVYKQARSVFAFETNKAGPSKIWANADIGHKAVYKALKIDPADPAAFYAAFPFRLAMMGERARIVIAITPPLIATKGNEHWHHTDIDLVLSWNPVENTVEVIGDTQPMAVFPDEMGDAVEVYGDGFKFFRRWIERRAEFWQRRTDSAKNKWKHPAVEPRDGGLPAILCVGDVRQIRWQTHDLPPVINAVGIDRDALNASIFKSAAVPRVVDKNTILRVAA